MNYPGHLGVGVLTFGVVAHNIDLKDEVSLFHMIILLAITMFSASKIIDKDLKFAIFLPPNMRHKRYLYHRQTTHSLVLWLLMLGLGIFGLGISIENIMNLNYNMNYYILFFAVGGLSHLLADMLTGSVPIFLWGKYHRGFRIGLNFSDTFKRFMVKTGDKTYILMIVAGIFLAYVDGNINDISLEPVKEMYKNIISMI